MADSKRCATAARGLTVVPRAAATQLGHPMPLLITAAAAAAAAPALAARARATPPAHRHAAAILMRALRSLRRCAEPSSLHVGLSTWRPPCFSSSASLVGCLSTRRPVSSLASLPVGLSPHRLVFSSASLLGRLSPRRPVFPPRSRGGAVNGGTASTERSWYGGGEQGRESTTTRTTVQGGANPWHYRTSGVHAIPVTIDSLRRALLAFCCW